MASPWHEGRLIGFDLETTAPDPEEARIVSAAIVVVGGGQPTEARTWLADPGVPIPEEATAVHGITTEQAQAEGRRAADVVREVLDFLVVVGVSVLPLVAFNARYDLTVTDRERARHGIDFPPLTEWERLRVVDPLVCDRWLDRFRKTKNTGSRKLEGMCAHYGVTLDGAHDATFDALAACRLAYRMGRLPGELAVVRQIRHWGGHARSDAAERAAMVQTWDDVRSDLRALHEFQRGEAEAERVRFAAYQRSIGEHDVAARVESERGWPVLEPRAVTA